MNILVTAPTEREYTNMVNTIRRASALRHQYTIIRCGIGKAAAAANTTKAIICSQKPYDMIAVIGFAAGSAGFRQGDIVVPDTARYHDCDIPEGFIPEVTDARPLCGREAITVFTGDSFVNAASVVEIKRRFGAERAIFDMEITAVAIAAEQAGNIPVVAVKMISDVPESGDTEFSYDAFADAHADFSEIVRRIEEF